MRLDLLAQNTASETIVFARNWAKGIDVKICPVCEESMYVNDQPKKVAIMIGFGVIVGWACSYCGSRFDAENNVIILKISNEQIAGIA